MFSHTFFVLIGFGTVGPIFIFFMTYKVWRVTRVTGFKYLLVAQAITLVFVLLPLLSLLQGVFPFLRFLPLWGGDSWASILSMATTCIAWWLLYKHFSVAESND